MIKFDLLKSTFIAENSCQYYGEANNKNKGFSCQGKVISSALSKMKSSGFAQKNNHQ